MTKDEVDFDTWYDALLCTLKDHGIFGFDCPEVVMEYYLQGKDVDTVFDEIYEDYIYDI